MRQDRPRIKVELMTKEGCCLCEEMKAILEEARRFIPFEVVEIDISQDGELLERYGEEIPVLFINGRKAFKYRATLDELMRKLERAAKTC